MKVKKPAKARKPVKTRRVKAAAQAKARSTPRSSARRKAPKRTTQKTSLVKRKVVNPRRAVNKRGLKKSPAKRRGALRVPPSVRSPVHPRTGSVPGAEPQAVAVVLPEVLLQGDRPGSPASGPGVRYALGATAPEAHFTEAGELPEAYGTQQVIVAARDPHWLYVHWDLTRGQLLDYNARSVHKHLVLRVAKCGGEDEPTNEVHVHPESRHWFVQVAQAGVEYAVELGYHGKAGGWTSISTSAPTLAPPDMISTETDVKFATLPTDVALSRLVEIVKTGAGTNLSLTHALEELRLAGHPELPPVTDDGVATESWTPEQEHALAEVISMKQLGRISVGSLDITELVQRGLQENYSSIMAALGGPGGISSPSSPQGGQPAGPGGFWFNLNAELIIYGATEPNATVTIGGRPVTLRPDGSFSYRFALPDGQYELPVTAVSADGTEARHAEMRFSRRTGYVGDVGQHPQDPALPTPAPENI